MVGSQSSILDFATDEEPQYQGQSSAPSSKPSNHVRRDPITRNEDVMIYIDLDNMDGFFNENSTSQHQDFRVLKTFIKYVAQKQE
ncbi:hypothetical protein BGX31_007989 [Mortierella sp. GBA43]|nr:hypothetical protein BGX31_007989 [Mortierella sp. GBA43]